MWINRCATRIGQPPWLSTEQSLTHPRPGLRISLVMSSNVRAQQTQETPLSFALLEQAPARMNAKNENRQELEWSVYTPGVNQVHPRDSDQPDGSYCRRSAAAHRDRPPGAAAHPDRRY